MAKEVLTKLSDNDLAQVCGGQIYFATGENGPRWYVPSPTCNRNIYDYSYSGWFSTEEGAVTYARVNGLWMDVTPCESYQQASDAAEAKGVLYEIRGKAPNQMNPSKWEEQLTELIWYGKVTRFSY